MNEPIWTWRVTLFTGRTFTIEATVRQAWTVAENHAQGEYIVSLIRSDSKLYNLKGVK